MIQSNLTKCSARVSGAMRKYSCEKEVGGMNEYDDVNNDDE
jgi:hypothetical protein